MLLPVPPKSSIEPRRKQKFYDLATEIYSYAEELERYKSSDEYGYESQEEKDLIDKELTLMEELNNFQVEVINKIA